MRAVPLRLRGSLCVCVLLACGLMPSSRVTAQMLEQPVTTIFGGLGTRQLATGRDGAILQVADPVVVVRLFPAGASTPSGTITIGDDGAAARSAVTALRDGGFAAAWQERGTLPVVGFQFRAVTRRLSPAGVPTGPVVPATPFGNVTDVPGIAPLGDGFVVVARSDGDIVAQRFDATGTAVGGNVFITQSGVANTRAVGLPGDRVLVVWGREANTSAQLFAADLTPLGAVFTVATSFEATGLAVNPAGTLAALVGLVNGEGATPDEARIRFFAPDGSSLGSESVVAVGDQSPDVAADASGNFLVMAGLSARAYDAAGVPLGPQVTFGPALPVQRWDGVRVAGRREGGFLAMHSGSERSYVARITLCVPGTAVCGDGTLVPTCEICDDGAANSNTTPDACRTNCLLPSCGDGATDANEQCDDGNHKNCDGCSELCQIEAGTVCGDGLVAPPGCKEQCDDGGADSGDGCSPTCKIERIFGGGQSRTDCYATWRIDNPSNAPRFEKRGGVSPKQRCRDNEAACDFDGGLAGSCTFHVALCVNNSEPTGCVSDRLQSWTIVTPSASQALTRPPLAAARAALAAVVVPNVIGPGDADICSPDADVVVPLRGAPGAYKASKLTLKTSAAVYAGDVDVDKLQLRCDP